MIQYHHPGPNEMTYVTQYHISFADCISEVYDPQYDEATTVHVLYNGSASRSSQHQTASYYGRQPLAPVAPVAPVAPNHHMPTHAAMVQQVAPAPSPPATMDIETFLNTFKKFQDIGLPLDQMMAVTRAQKQGGQSGSGN